MTKEQKRKRKRVIRCIIALIITIIAFFMAQDYALRWRGYSAIGGEYFLFMVPMLYLFGEITAADMKEEWKKIKQEEVEENE